MPEGFMLINSAPRIDSAVEIGRGMRPESGTRIAFEEIPPNQPPASSRSNFPKPRASKLERLSFRKLLDLLDKEHEFELETLRLEISGLQTGRCRECREREQERVSEWSKKRWPEVHCDVSLPVQTEERVSEWSKKRGPEVHCDVSLPVQTEVQDQALAAAADVPEEEKKATQAIASVSFDKVSCDATDHTTSKLAVSFPMRPHWKEEARMGLKNATSMDVRDLQSMIKGRERLTVVEVMEGRGRMDECLDRLLMRCMLEPSSSFRLVWSFLSVFLLAFDIVLVPVDCFFKLSQESYLLILDWASRLFWSFDLLLSFIAGTYILGSLEMRPSRVIRRYLVVWFPVDLLLVVSDWLSLLGLSGSVADMIPLLRASRLLRLLRLLKLDKLKSIFDDVMRVMPESVAVCAVIIKLILMIFLMIHVIACLWYGVGVASPDGWAYELQTSPTHYAYLRSVHFTTAQLHGTTPFQPQSAVEHGVATATLLLGFIAAAVFIGNVSHVVTKMTDSNDEHVQQSCRRYLRARKVSVKLQLRLNRYLASNRKRRSFKDQVAHEQELIQALPLIILQDINEEVRKPVLVCNTFLFHVGDAFPMFLRRLCHEGLQSLVYNAKESVFYAGDEASSLIVSESGTCTYFLARRHDKDGNSYTVADPHRSDVGKLKKGLSQAFTGTTLFSRTSPFSGPSTTGAISRGNFLSEAALWTTWVHMGDLVCETDSTLLGLQNAKFETIVSMFDLQITNRAIQYCRAFLSHLNGLSRAQMLSDVVDFSIEPSELEQPLTPTDHHFAFLSHYKAEAGTEATLLREEMEALIGNDPMHGANLFESPIFVDSEDLTDLSTLMLHVEKSDNLALLLTPGVLTRPWCVLEIVTAIRNNIPIVPIEIQRPGMSFKYPSEEHYQSLLDGQVFGEAGNRILREHGVEAQEVADCVRKVFLKIAVPYSPHKASKIRAAEIEEIVGRCVMRDSLEASG